MENFEDLSDYICNFAYGKEIAIFVCKSKYVPGQVIASHVGLPVFIKAIEEFLRERGAKITILMEKTLDFKNQQVDETLEGYSNSRNMKWLKKIL